MPVGKRANTLASLLAIASLMALLKNAKAPSRRASRSRWPLRACSMMQRAGRRRTVCPGAEELPSGKQCSALFESLRCEAQIVWPEHFRSDELVNLCHGRHMPQGRLAVLSWWMSRMRLVFGAVPNRRIDGG